MKESVRGGSGKWGWSTPFLGSVLAPVEAAPLQRFSATEEWATGVDTAREGALPYPAMLGRPTRSHSL